MQITICSDHAEFPDLKLTTFGTKPIFEKLRSVRQSSLEAASLVPRIPRCVLHQRSPVATLRCELRRTRVRASMQAKERSSRLCKHVGAWRPEHKVMGTCTCLQAWSQARIATAVGEHDVHHV